MWFLSAARADALTSVPAREESQIDIRLKRAHASPVPADGFRVLVDRLWPRGVSRERAKLDAWEKAVMGPELEAMRWPGGSISGSDDGWDDCDE